MDCEVLQATIDEEAFPISVVAAAKELSRWTTLSLHLGIVMQSWD